MPIVTEEIDSALCLELKYCEGCGALGLRPAGRAIAYCASCEKKLPRTNVENRRADEEARRTS